MAEKEDLEWLLKLLAQIKKEGGHEWFWNEIKRKYSSAVPSVILSDKTDIEKLLDDIRRTKYFLKNIDRELHVEGHKFYTNIVDPDLKKVLKQDYKEMKVALRASDILEYSRRLCLQIERVFSHVITKVSAWEIIKSHKEYELVTIITEEFRGKTYNPQFKMKEIFFWKNDEGLVNKEVSEIEFKAKAAFCFYYYKLDSKKHWTNLTDIYFLRNKASHGSNLSAKDVTKLSKIIEKFDDKNHYYQKTFDYIVKGLKGLYE